MKLLLLLLLSFLSVKGFAQIDANEVIKKKIEGILKEHPDRVTKFKSFLEKRGSRVEAASTTPLNAPYTPGVYSLPQDGMLCVVPRTEGLTAMPNASKVVKVPFRSQIPNAYQPRVTKPEDATK